MIQINGALTVGTLDGANVEMSEEMGRENIFIFGMTVEEVEKLKSDGYDPVKYYEGNEELKKCIDAIRDGVFSPDAPDRFHNLVDSLLVHGDRSVFSGRRAPAPPPLTAARHGPFPARFCLLADYASYVKIQEKISEEFRDRRGWARKCIRNVAAGGL